MLSSGRLSSLISVLVRQDIVSPAIISVTAYEIWRLHIYTLYTWAFAELHRPDRYAGLPVLVETCACCHACCICITSHLYLLLSYLLSPWLSLKAETFNVTGEDEKGIRPMLKKLHANGIGAILDYAAEDDGGSDEGPKSRQDEHSSVVARTYDYETEASCDKHRDIFMRSIMAASDAPGQGFAAIKVRHSFDAQRDIWLKLRSAMTSPSPLPRSGPAACMQTHSIFCLSIYWCCYITTIFSWHVAH